MERKYVESLIQTLAGFGKAYPESVFPPVTAGERASLHTDHPGLRERLAADMGRHFGKFMVDAANALRELLEENDRLKQAPDGVEPVAWRYKGSDGYWRLEYPHHCEVTDTEPLYSAAQLAAVMKREGQR